MLTALPKEYPDSGHVFTTERGTPSRHQSARSSAPHSVSSAFPHAAAFLRPTSSLGLARPRLDHPHHALRGIEPDPVKGLLVGLSVVVPAAVELSVISRV
jgi:hypothetical protein